jgi:hypothetical protein
MRSLVPLALAAVTAAAQAQTLEQRAAEVRNTLAAPPPVETVIQSGPAAVGRAVSPAAAASAPATAPIAAPTAVQTPTIQPVPASPELTGRTNALFGGQPAGSDGRGIGVTGTPQWLSNPRVPTHIPGIFTPATSGQTVRGASNLTTAPRGFSAGDSNP